MSEAHVSVAPGGTIGVFGGGQLGRMLGIAARRLGFRFAVYSDDAGGPAAQIADHAVQGDYDDADAIAAFAKSIDAATFEFENVPAIAGEVAARYVPVRPHGSLLHTVQDRQREKEGLVALELPVAKFMPVRSADELRAAAAAIPGPGVLKTSSFGYDGKGQCKIDSAAELEGAWKLLGEVPTVLETLVPFVEEISVVAVRGANGDIALYEPFSNHHENHILDVTTCPARLTPETHQEVERIARIALEGLDVVGVLCIELFLLEGGAIIVNEIAPRPHNSGHLTIDSHVCCQFQNQARAVAGLPVGSTERVGPPAAMSNLLGDLWADGEPNWAAALRIPTVSLHLYGKNEPRPGRKMGHITTLGETTEIAAERAREARHALLGRR